ncbi:M20 family metallopeptidase [Fusibacter paucivorans]|uniref:Peptidase M20 domain-containing protein 2 n=1 Tax=Fusibacter paucivorans TaxID=76009 RepID=A0ABS5PU17_9FIRM|nr:M20 family metallopeptidase [Fusibacter paucivorans]MBS7528061.1 M20 family metallopeptidase [Fusibacter paucivorans]
MTIEALKSLLYQAEDSVAALGENVCDTIFKHPELGDQEFFSAKFLTDEMAKLGFSVTMPYCGVETAFRCEFGDDEGPRIGFLAEYDALPGYGALKNENGHACGHNWIAGSTFAACAALQKVKEHFKGKIVFIGTPAEETDGRKIDIMNAGGFDDLDAAFQLHLSSYNAVDCVALACTDVTFEFKGKAVHASSRPEDGINALDACNLTFAGVNALRQHVSSDVRIHGIIKEGGAACNTVPDQCSMQLFVRAADKDYLENVVERVVNCAKGAELMTGAKLTWRRAQNTFYDYKVIPELQEKLKNNMIAQGVEGFVTEDIYHSGSTDIGNVSYACPTSYGYLGTSAVTDAQPHDVAYLDIVNSPFAYELLHKGAKAMAATAIDVFCDDAFRAKINNFYAKKQA